LFIVARAEYFRRDVQLMAVMLGVLSLLRGNVEFLILIESQARCVLGLKLLCEKILHVKHIVGFHTGGFQTLDSVAEGNWVMIR
jgi:hypothetical protein